MPVTQETPTPDPRTPKGRDIPAIDRSLDTMKTGKGPTAAKLFEQAQALDPAAKQAALEHLQQTEHCSEAFATTLLEQPALLRRVSNLANNFAENGETMGSLEQAEIYTELMEPSSDDIFKVLETANPASSFRHLQPLRPGEIVRERMNTVRKSINGLGDRGTRSLAREQMQNAFTNAGLGSIDDEASWERLASDPEAVQALRQDQRMREIYSAVMDDQSMDRVENNLEMLWRETDGETRPVLHVHRYAKNPETGHVSELGFDIEKEGDSRIVKNILVVTDSRSRGENQGPEFLLNLLPLIRAYGLKEAEFVANINIGSYAWTKIADMDVNVMKKFLSLKAREEIERAGGDEKVAKGIVMRETILPKFEQKMAAAFATVILAETDPQKREVLSKTADTLMNVVYEELKARALNGEATMEDLANLGKGLDLFDFDKDGNIVPPGSEGAVMKGHLGKASIMGISWKARIPLDRNSLFGLIDKMNKGKGVMASLKRTSKKLGLMFTA